MTAPALKPRQTTAARLLAKPRLAIESVRTRGRLGDLLLVATLSIASLGVTGCGSASTVTTTAPAAPTGNRAPAITKSAFVSKANAICAKGNAANEAAGAKLGAEPSEVQVVAFVKNTEIPAVQAQIDAIKALGAPAGDDATVARMLALAQDGVDAVKRRPAIVTTRADVFARFARVAHPYGLTSCSPKS